MNISATGICMVITIIAVTFLIALMICFLAAFIHPPMLFFIMHSLRPEAKSSVPMGLTGGCISGSLKVHRDYMGCIETSRVTIL